MDILKVHSKGKPLSADVDLDNVAKRMPYSTGADLENVMNEAAILAGENVCSYEDIDKACELGYNLPMGPLKLADAIGIDIMISVMESLYQETADSKYRPALTMKKMVRAGLLGQKTGEGFYKYNK